MSARTGVARVLTHAGKSQSVSAWARDLGLSRKLICTRLNQLGWSVAEALSTVTHVAPSGKNYGAGHLKDGYLVKSVEGVQRAEHIMVAERAFGRPLPTGAVVHHVDEDPLNNDPTNLVICPDQAYHMLLHRRMRALAACGHADWRKCKYCGQYSRPEALRITLHGAYHRECFNANARAKYHQRKEAK